MQPNEAWGQHLGSKVCFNIFFDDVSCILWSQYLTILENSDYNNTIQILTPDTFVFFYNTTHCLPILSLWTLNVYIVTKIQSNFHANRTVILAVTCNSRQKNGWFWFFAKNIYHPQNYKYGKWGKFLYNEKNQTHPLLFLMRLIFLDFWFSRFLYKFIILRIKN